MGKSTVAEEFGRNEYGSYLLVDFAKASEAVRNAFTRYVSDLDTLFMILSAEYGVTLRPGNSLVILDEVQLFLPARQAVKHLVADGRYHYLETGSLISIRDTSQEILIPSEERRLPMYPMDFEEFCRALGEQPMIEYISDRFAKRKPLEDDLHHKAMLLFRQYMLVGGMPRSVAAGYPLFFFTRYNAQKHRNDIEIDFIVSNKSKINPKLYPIEVKSSKAYATKSLDRFGDVYRKRIGEEYVIHTKGLAQTDNRLYVPAYMTFCL